MALTNGCQQQTENEEAVGSSKITRPGDSKQVRRDQDSIRIPHKTSDMMSGDMKLVFGGIVRTKIVEQVYLNLFIGLVNFFLSNWIQTVVLNSFA